jgi:hypothetical protein
MWSVAFDNSSDDLSIEIIKNQASEPKLILLFGDTDNLSQSQIPKNLQDEFPNAKVFGCSTGTSLVNKKLSNEFISGIAMGFASSRVDYASVDIENAKDSFNLGAQLGRNLKQPDLAAVFIISDGLNVNGSDIVGGILSVLGGRVKVSGGLAGDGARFGKTILIENGQVVDNKIIAIGFYGDKIKVSHGSEGGWQEFGEEFDITKSDGNVMYELDGKNAYEVYAGFLGEQADHLPGSGLLYPLRIWHPDYPQHDIVRTLLSVDSQEGTLTFAGDVPEGWRAGLMIGNTAKLVEGAQTASQKAVSAFKEINKTDPKVCLMVSCVGRRLLLGEETQDELEAVAQNLPQDTNMVGFYSYGEIAPHKLTRLCSLHNQTVTLTMLGEVE